MNLFVAFCFARINKGGVRNDKEISRFNRIRKLNMLIDGTSYAMFEAHLDKEAYENQKR